jgi:polyphosphate glucokinase
MKRRILVIDVGGTNVKVQMRGRRSRLKIPSGPRMTPRRLVAAVKAATRGWRYDAITIGVPTPVVNDAIAEEPANLGRGWVRFNFARAFHRPVHLLNDAAMQALGSYQGGKMLFLGLGTGLGSALVVEGFVVPLELAHLPFRKGEYEDYVGVRGHRKYGGRRWRKYVDEVARLLQAGLVADYVVLGGGNAKLLKKLPRGCRLGSNTNALAGGIRAWQSR